VTTPAFGLVHGPAVIDRSQIVAAELDRMRSALVETTSLDEIETYSELVTDTLMTDSLCYLQGPPGSCKSFVALDLAGSVATGSAWHGKTTQKGRVLYVAAEGTGGLRKRVRAWESARAQMMYGVSILPESVQVMSPVGGTAFVMLCQEIMPQFVIIDTQARCSVGLNENSAQEMGTFVAQVETIRTITRACVLIVHHEGRTGEHLRGSTVMEGAAQTVLRCTKEGKIVTLRVVKQKDGEELPPLEMVIRPVNSSIVLDRLHRQWDNAVPVQPTFLMRKISDALENAGEPLTVRGIQDRVQGRQENVRAALAHLIDDNYVKAVQGTRGAILHTLHRAFREVSVS
jgi:AAA domain